MSDCSGCGASLDCEGDSDTLFPYSLTPGSPFPYVINCPEGVNCNTALSVTMECCGTPITADIPEGTSLEERAAILQRLVAQCSLLESGCSNPPTGSPNPTPGEPIPPTTQLFLSSRTTASIECAEKYGGGTYSFIIEAGRFLGFTQESVDAQVRKYAQAQSMARRFCLNIPCLCPCADVATTLNINTVGGTGPFSVEITSGSLPTGLTMTVVGGVLRVTGTPTTEGNSTITVKVYDGLGGWLTKNLTFYVIGITTSSPLPNYEAGVAYSKQLEVTGGIGPFAWSVLSGSLPAGLLLSDTGLISGTPTGSGEATFEVIAVDTGLTGHQGCSKEFTIDQEGEVVLYFAMDDFVNVGGTDYALNAVPSPQDTNLDLPLTGATYLSVVTGKIDDAFQADQTGVPVLPRTMTLASDGFGFGDMLNLADKSWTIRFWMKHPTNFFDDSVFMLWIGDINHENGVRLTYLNNSGEFPFNRYRLEADNGDFSSSDVTLDSALIDGTTTWQDWHRVIVVYDASTTTFKIKINDDAFETISEPSFVMSDISRALFALPRGGSTIFSHYIIDELAVINGAAWDDDDCTYDWNSGAGRTYPDLPS